MIAALSGATVVVEAGWRSGSLNTAGHAATLGRPLGAVPGPVTSSTSAGCHRLLREYDATCVTTPEEMAELLPVLGFRDRSETDLPAGDDSENRGRGSDRPDPEGVRTRVLDALSSRSARSVETLAVSSGLAVERVRSELGLLELERAARRGDDGWTRGA